MGYEPADSPRQYSEKELFEAACERTRSALSQLAARWRDVPKPPNSLGLEAGVADAAARVAENEAGEFTEEGYAWSRKVGMHFVAPQMAIRGCRATPTSLGCDGLNASMSGVGYLIGLGWDEDRASVHQGLFIAPTPPCGCGLFTTTKLRKGQYLGEYTGEVRNYKVWVNEIESKKRAERGTDSPVPFIYGELYSAWTGGGPAGEGVVIDASKAGNPMRFINSSCSPNCTFKAFGDSDEKHHRLAVATTRVIEPWEQLSLDYGWYFDDATMKDVNAQALEAYMEDRLAISSLASMPIVADDGPDVVMSAGLSISDAVQTVKYALFEANIGCNSMAVTDSLFLRRFVEPESVAKLLKKSDGKPLPEASDHKEIPDEIWALYEVVGATRVGIPCRCALEPSLNPRGKCGGIIGRPVHTTLSERESEHILIQEAPEWLGWDGSSPSA